MPELQVNELSREVERIITSPYPVAIKNLHNLVSTCDNVSICEWADAHRVQVPALAAAMLEGMQLWSHTLEIISALSQARCFRDACLAQSPSILNDLLCLASEANEGSEQASKACASFLTHRLPSTIALPSTAQDFLNRLFEEAVKYPSSQNAKRLHDVLSGACEEVLELLPSASLTRFRENLFMLMKKDIKGDEQLLTLLSLSILGKIRDCCITPRPVRSGSTLSLTQSMSEDDRREIDKYFAGEWAHKTMTLVFLQCIRACGADGELESARYRLRLAREIMHSVDPQSREEWVKKNSRYLQKLMQKATQSALDPLLKLEATSIVSIFCAAEDAPDSVIEAFETSLISSVSLPLSRDTLHSALQNSAWLMSNRISQSFWHSVILTTINSVCEYHYHKSNESDASIMLNNDLKDLVTKSQVARSGISESLCSNELTKPLDRFCAFEHRSVVTADAIELEESFLSLLFKVDLLSRGSEARLPQDTMEQMLCKQRQLVLTPRVDAPQLYRPKVQNFQIEDRLDQARPSSHYWKELLVAELNGQARETQKVVTHLLAGTCEDLEKRCQGIEEPLRKKEEERAALQHRNEVLSSETEQLREAYSKQESEINGIRQDLSLVEQESNEASSMIEERQTTIEALEEKIKNLKRDKDLDMSSLRSKYDQQDLELRTSIAYQVEQINNQQNELQKLKQELASRSETADSAAKQAEMRGNELSKSLAVVQQSLECEKEVVTAKTKEIALLTENGNGLRTKSTELENETKRLSTRISCLEEEATNAQTSHKQTLQSVSDLHEEVRFLSEQAESAQARLKQHLAATENELDQTRSEQAHGLRKKDNRIKELQDKLKRLSRELKDTSAQLQDARTLENNLVSMLGCDPQINQKYQSKGLSRKEDSNRTQVQNLDLDQVTQDVSDDDCLGESEIEADEGPQPPESEQSEQSASSASTTGPTPKRAKSSNSKPFKPPMRDVQTKGHSSGPFDPQSRAISSRMPLGEAQPRRLNPRSDSNLDRSMKFTRSLEQQRLPKQTDVNITASIGEQAPQDSDEENHEINVDFEGGNSGTGKAHKVGERADFSFLRDFVTQDFDDTTVEL